MQLRPYQAAALSKFERSREKSCLIVAPTGAGKGTMATELMVRAHRKRQRAVFVVHRREIVHDILGRLAARGVKCAQTRLSDRYVRVVSVQSLLRAEGMRPVDLLVVDEAHHYAAAEWQEVVSRIDCKRIVGFTATPQRADGKPLGDMFTEIIDTVRYSDLTRAGLLVPARVLRPAKSLENDLAQDPVEMYLAHARGEQALMFVRRVDDADQARDRLRRHGIAAESVHAKTPKDERDRIMQRLEAGDVRVVANVGTLTEGVDVPHVTTCILARPCAHASTYVQIVGRVLRSAPGKKLATVIDLVGASHRHGLPGADQAYSLEGDGLHVREREGGWRSGPSGPHRDQEVLGVELEEVHTYQKTLPPAPKPAPPPKPEVERYANGRIKRDQSKSGRTVKELGQKARAPLTRPAPAARSAGCIAQEKSGHWKLIWHEHGTKRTLGLCTKDEDEAKRTHALFQAEGVLAVQTEVLRRKRTGASVWRHRESQWWYLTAWDETLTRKKKWALGTPDAGEAERLLAIFKRDRAAFERAIAKNKPKAAEAQRGKQLAAIAAQQAAE